MWPLAVFYTPSLVVSWHCGGGLHLAKMFRGNAVCLWKSQQCPIHRDGLDSGSSFCVCQHSFYLYLLNSILKGWNMPYVFFWIDTCIGSYLMYMCVIMCVFVCVYIYNVYTYIHIYICIYNIRKYCFHFIPNKINNNNNRIILVLLKKFS